MLQQFIQDEGGATAIEYALIASLIALAILASVQAFGESSVAMYGKIETAVLTAAGG